MKAILSNHYKAELHKGNINFLADQFKLILMATGFKFDMDAHATYASVSTSELATANGYTQNATVLANIDTTAIEDDVNDRSAISWANTVWNATGGEIGPTPGAIIYDDTTVDDTVVGFIDFRTETWVDCTKAPPTEADGDVYILDYSLGTVHAGWDGASKGESVRFNGTTQLWEVQPRTEQKATDAGTFTVAQPTVELV